MNTSNFSLLCSPSWLCYCYTTSGCTLPWWNLITCSGQLVWPLLAYYWGVRWFWPTKVGHGYLSSAKSDSLNYRFSKESLYKYVYNVLVMLIVRHSEAIMWRFMFFLFVSTSGCLIALEVPSSASWVLTSSHNGYVTWQCGCVSAP